MNVRTASRAAWLVLAATTLGCSIYDPSLVEGTGGGGAGSPTTTSGTTTASGTGGSGGSGGSGGATTTTTGTGGAGGSGGGTTTTGTGGSGGQGGCTLPNECPGTDTECRTRTCTQGVCGFDFTDEGLAVAQQTPNDCLEVVCDGMGDTKTIPDDLDLPDDMNECTTDTCAMGMPSSTNKSLGSPCGPGGALKCNAAASCVECLVGADCPSLVCDDMFTCAAAQCGDKVKNGTETGLDCGGPTCPKCPTGGTCLIDTDCVGGTCTSNVCAPTCTDMVKNGGETDTDCGGPTCAKCDVGKACTAGGDCSTGSCLNGFCACAGDHLVISEIRSRGPVVGANTGTDNDFVELYNPTAAPITLDTDWKLEVRSSAAANYAARWTGAGVSIPAHGYFLIKGTAFTGPAHDGSLSVSITDASSLKLTYKGATVDAVCYAFNNTTKTTLLNMGMAMGYVCEGTPVDNLPHNNTSGAGDVDVSIERRPAGGLGNCIDSGDNAADFIKATPSSPQNTASPAIP